LAEGANGLTLTFLRGQPSQLDLSIWALRGFDRELRIRQWLGPGFRNNDCGSKQEHCGLRAIQLLRVIGLSRLRWTNKFEAAIALITDLFCAEFNLLLVGRAVAPSHPAHTRLRSFLSWPFSKKLQRHASNWALSAYCYSNH
jgi:hypothetical protein